MRLFIALGIPSENLLQFQAIQSKLRTLIPQARLTDLGKIHLTLAFLGEQPDALRDKLAVIIQEASENIPSFKVTPAYIDGFPNLHHSQVLWVGVKGDTEKPSQNRSKIGSKFGKNHDPSI